ncbi:MAG TPA: ATP-binding cassette domain-containing protein [Actinomycetota bacterium]|nr:ATP-binding cassette domain-containing protein [Actinomycetota bacterium]
MQVLTAVLLSLGNIGAYAILAVGIVMIYRASRVLNLAHGAMAMIPAYVVYTLNTQLRVPAAVAFVLGVASGGLLGYGVEKVFIRRLRAQSTTAQTVGTVAALGLLVAAAAKIWGTTGLPSVRMFPDGFVSVGQSSINYGEFGLFAVMLVVTGALFVLFTRTDIGLVMRGTAENRRAAALMGVNPDRVTALAWIIGGGLAGLSGILLASNTTNLHPYVLSFQALFGFVAALIAGMASLPGAVGGAAVVGIVLGLVPIAGAVGQLQGAPQLLLAVIAIAAMAYRGRSIVGGEDVRGAGAIARGNDTGPTLADLPGRRVLAVIGVFLFVAAPFKLSYALLGSTNRGAIFAIVAASLVMLTGWVGQISLGHAAFVGVGAYATGWFAQGFGIPFPLNLPLAALSGAVIALGLGAVAVRVRGLYLAVATLIFSWTASEFLFRQPWFTKHGSIDARPIGRPGTFPYFDFSDRRVFYFVAWAVAIATLYAASNLRNSKTGRAFFAVQGSEMAAASLGINVVRYKALAFSLSGAMAATAGNLVIVDARAIVPDQFFINVSLLLLSIAVVGGLASLGGAVASALVFASLDYLFFRIQALSGLLEVTSALLLAVVLLVYQGGLAAAGRRLVRLVCESARATAVLRLVDRATDQVLDDVAWLAGFMRDRWRIRLSRWGIEPPVPAAAAAGVGSVEVEGGEEPGRPGPFASLVRFVPRVSRAVTNGNGSPSLVHLEPERIEGRRDAPVVLRADEVTVRFGGLTAVDDVSLEVREGEIVGLIGPNGAGKSVTFNSVAGLVVPTAGRIWLHGTDVSELPVHERAAMGIARTFQAIQLFPQLSVFDNLLVATHLQNRTGWASHVVVSHPSIQAEREARQRVSEVVERLDLTEVADRRVGDLPFGVLRIVEVARALVTGFRFIMLDEPASGLDGTETEGLTEVLRRLRDEEGMTLLLIEHDVKMVTSVSDYMYVLDRGRMIAQGVPDVVKRDPQVIAAYLGKPVEEMVGVGS